MVWVTNESPQSRSLLAGEDVEWVDYVAPRDLLTAVRLLPTAHRIVRRPGVDLVISTGSAIAVPFLVAATANGRSTFYIESATRADGPSLTARILSFVPGVQLRTQSATWSSRRWKFVGSVFDGWTAAVVPAQPIRNIVVSLGTMKRYQFRSLVDRLLEIVPPQTQVLWQVGATDVSDLPIDARGSVPAAELSAAMRAADVIVAHAGTGVALTAMEMGKSPVLVPRRAARDEHVDDHQQQTAQLLGCAGLAVVAEVGELTWEHLERAAARRIVARVDGPRIELSPRRR